MTRHINSDYPTEEISWTFNDFLLGFLMIILMMTCMFAFLSNAVVVNSFINQCEDPNDPNCGVGNSLFGGRERGQSLDKVVMHDTAEDAASSIQSSVQKWAGMGQMGGDSLEDFGSVSLNPLKANLIFEILPDGQLVYRGETIEISKMKEVINELSLEKGVFLEAIVHADTPFEVYKKVRNQLWDLADAEHWRDIVQTPENAALIQEQISRYGTTYLEALEIDVLKNAPKKPDTNSFDTNENTSSKEPFTESSSEDWEDATFEP